MPMNKDYITLDVIDDTGLGITQMLNSLIQLYLITTQDETTDVFFGMMKLMMDL